MKRRKVMNRLMVVGSILLSLALVVKWARDKEKAQVVSEPAGQAS